MSVMAMLVAIFIFFNLVPSSNLCLYVMTYCVFAKPKALKQPCALASLRKASRFGSSPSVNTTCIGGKEFIVGIKMV